MEHLAKLAEHAGLLCFGDVKQEFDSLKAEARVLVESRLGEEDRDALAQLLNSSAERAGEDWIRIVTGRPMTRDQAPRAGDAEGQIRGAAREPRASSLSLPSDIMLIPRRDVEQGGISERSR